MELKQVGYQHLSPVFLLLIVPYGIETTLPPVESVFVRVLLIVPYGIETYLTSVPFRPYPDLLIVPYGIETASEFRIAYRLFLLIVPYGIETCNFPVRT